MIGATVMHETVAERAEPRLDDIIKNLGGSQDCKWAKVKKHNRDVYEDIVNAFFKGVGAGWFHYYALVVDNSKMNHKLFNDGDKEIGFNKMLFQLLFQFARKYRNRPRFYAYLDHRTTIHTPERMRQMLNGRAHKTLSVTHNPFRVCQFRHSEEVRLIQATDVITGAIAYHTNHRHFELNAASPKVELAQMIADKANLPFLSKPTPYSDSGFDIWHIDLTASAASRAPRP